MADLKLPPLPDRTPIKLSISILPDLHQALNDYAERYGRDEPISELIPAMLRAFIDSDRAFSRRSGS